MGVFKRTVDFIKREGAREAAMEAARTWLLPPLATGVAALIGIAEGVPWFYVIVGASVIFAGVSVSLLRFSEWLHKQDAEHKLTIQKVRIGKQLSSEGAVSKVCLGVQFSNAADFPMEFRVDLMESELNQKFPPKQPFERTNFTVPAGGIGWFDDHFIKLGEKISNTSVEGALNFSVTYGRQGHLEHTLSERMKIFLVFNDNGDIKASNWINA